jgi:hypothetical protein
MAGRMWAYASHGCCAYATSVGESGTVPVPMVSRSMSPRRIAKTTMKVIGTMQSG